MRDIRTSPPTFSDIEVAAGRLTGIASRTPVLTSRTVNRVTGATAFFKCENFQRTGSFKFRGAYNALAILKEKGTTSAVLTYSSGNHAQAVALSASLLGMEAFIVMPTDAPAVKRAATEGYGGRIIPYERSETTREEVAGRMARDQGLPVIPPYDSRDVIAGQGTVARELLSVVPDLDLLLVCCGGGGLLSGSALAAKALGNGCRVIGVEPANADDATRSFQTGHLQTVHNPDTIADGARTPSLGKLTFPIILDLVDDMVTVTDDEIVAAMRFVWERMKIVVEPTGALAAAALLAKRVDCSGQRVGLVISGGNVDLARASELFSPTAD